MPDRPLLMIGSVPCETAEEVFRLLGPAIGDLLNGLSDGEPGYRNKWVFSTRRTYSSRTPTWRS